MGASSSSDWPARRDGQLEDRAFALGGLDEPFELRLEAEPTRRLAHRSARTSLRGASLAADDQPSAAGRDDVRQPAEVGGPPLLGTQTSSVRTKSKRRGGSHLSAFADEDAVGPLREARPRELGASRRQLEPERLDPRGPPA